LVVFSLVLATIGSTLVVHAILLVRGRAARLSTWLGVEGGWAVVAGLAGVGMAAWIVGGYDMSGATAMAGLVALTALATGTVTAGFSRLLGPPGLGLAGLIVVVANPTPSGGPARRPGPGGTREKILAAARSRFGQEGYDGTTIRGIAAGAGVDPALVPHYFGSKEGVFLAAVEFPVDPAEFIPRLLAPGIDGLGERLVTFFLETWDSPSGASLLGLIRSVVSSELAADLMREFVTREV